MFPDSFNLYLISGSRKESKIGVSVNPDAQNLGKIHVTLIEAKDLVKSDMIGKSDPYAIISHGNQKFKTNTVKNSQNPQWNYDADFNVPDQGDGRIKVDIFDADRIGKDKPLGSAYFDVDEVMSNGIIPPAWYPLKGAKSGEVLMSADFEPLGDGRVTYPEGDTPRFGLDKDSLKGGRPSIVDVSRPDLEEGILHLELLGAKNLVKADIAGKSDPYAIITLGDQTHKTDTVKNTQNPEWNFGVDFTIDDATPDSLKIKVFDQDKIGKDKSLGFVSLPVQVLLNDSDPNINRWIPLDGVKSGEVLVATNFRPFDEHERMSGRGLGRQSIAEDNGRANNGKNGDKKGSGALGDDDASGRRDSKGGARGLKSRMSSGSLYSDDSLEGKNKDRDGLRKKESAGSMLGEDSEIPKGNIKVNLNKAKNLMKADLIGKSDPYAIISCGDDKSKTKTIKNNLNPEWNHEVYFPVDNNTPRNINIQVFDADKFGKDESLGSANMDIADLVQNGPVLNQWLPLENAKSGEVQVSAEFDFGDPDYDKISPGSKKTSLDEGGRRGSKKASLGGAKSARDKLNEGKFDEEDLAPGAIKLELIQAKDLVKSDLVGKSDPYAVISFDADSIKTPVVKNNQNPEWNFNANIPVDEIGPRKIKIEVFDSDKHGKDKPIGTANLDVADLIYGNPLEKEWLPLAGVKSGKIQVSADFIPESELAEANRRPSRGGVHAGREGGKRRTGGDDDDGDYASSPNSRKPSEIMGRKPSGPGSPGGIPTGNLHFKITEAKDLVKADLIGKSDPYAILSYGDKKLKTNTVKNNQSPTWNFEGDMPIDDNGPRVIKLEVFDSDKHGKDKSLGCTTLDVLDIVENSPIDDTWVPLEGVKSGKVRISADFSPEGDYPDSGLKRKPSEFGNQHSEAAGDRKGSKFSADETEKARKGSRKASGFPDTDAAVVPGPGNLHVNVKKAKDLIKTDMIGKSDPYATITYDGHKKKSKVVKNSQNPEWNFEVDLPVDTNSPRDMKIEIYDSDRFGKDKSLGTAHIDVASLGNNEPLQDAWIPLNGTKSGYIQVCADYVPEDQLGQSPHNQEHGGGRAVRDKLRGPHSEDEDFGSKSDSRKRSDQGSRKPSNQDGSKGVGRPSGVLGDYDEIPAGNIHLEIAQAKDLVKKDLIGKSDPYALITYGEDKIKTKTVKNNQNPQWNFEADIPVYPDGPQSIRIDLFDEDKHGKDKPLGSVEIDIPNLINKESIDNEWIPLNGVKSGLIQVSADYNPDDDVSSRRPSAMGDPYGQHGKKPLQKKSSRDRFASPDRKSTGGMDVYASPDGRSSGSRKESVVQPGNLHLNIIQAKDLIKGDIMGKSDPYAVITYGNEKVKTNTVKNNQNPEWNFEADIPLHPNGPDVMKIEIFDSDKFGKDKSLGCTNIDIPSLQHSQSLSNIWVPLDNVKSGQVQLSAEFSPDKDFGSNYPGTSGAGPNSRTDPGSRKESREYDIVGPGSRKESQDLRSGRGGAMHVKDMLIGRKSSRDSPEFDSGSLGDPRYGKTPDDKLGTIRLDLLCAKDLIKTDVIGKSDPYAVIQYGETKFQTPVKNNTQNPDFSIQCNIDIPNNPKERNIIITIYDSDKLGKDKCIGTMNVDIGKVMNLGELKEDWYPLQGVKSGEVRMAADFIPDTIDELHIQQRYTEERRSSTQYHEVSLNRIPLPSGGGKIDANIRRPSGAIDTPLIEDNNNGTISVKYQPTEEGLHYLDVKYNGDQVQGSPFKFHVNKQNSGQAFGYGPGLTHGVCGEPAKFNISTKGAGAGGLSLAVEGPSKAEINCIDNKDGTVSVSYLPTAPGEYKIIAKFADKHIPGSPFTCKVTGDNKKKNQISVGSSSELQLPGDLSESDIRSLKAFIESPSGGIEQCFLKKLPKGNIGISFTPREVGEHLVSVQKNGKHITNSPFKITVNAQEVGDASRVRVSGEGLDRGKTHIYNRFQINTKSAGYGGLSLSIEGPSKAEIECKDNEDGTLDVEYKPTEPGFYIINIKFADSHVPGSPFQVPISGEGSAKQTENINRMREAVPVTEVGSKCRLTFKMPGIVLKDLEAVVASPSGNVTNADISELEEGLYAVNFVPYELGVHTVTVRYREMDIPGSPFQFTVGPLMDSGSHRVHAGNT